MKFDVFLSFRGTDTRKTFVSYLLLSLFKKQFRTFKHEEDLLVSQRAASQVLQAIEVSKVAVVVISENYTSSVSCLDELVKIIECKEKQSLVVVPVFYEVNPLDFERQAGELADKLGKHGERDNLQKVKRRDNSEANIVRWETALIEMTRTFQNYASGVEEDSEMIDKIMNYISLHLSGTISSKSRIKTRTPMTRIAKGYQNLRAALRFKISKIEMADEDVPIESVQTTPWSRSSMYRQQYLTDNELSWFDSSSSDFNSLVGMDRRMKSVYEILELESEDGVREIGFWGEVGVGKTTLLRYVYVKISQKFQDHYYHDILNDTRDYYVDHDATCLLEELTRPVITPISWNRLTSYCDVVKAKLRHRKVLLIVDGVDHMGQLKCIRKIASWFGPGSRLILVTQDKSLLLDHGIRHLYEVESLLYDEALQLFAHFAFKQNSITRGFDQLCIRAILVSGRSPLALKVFGSFLCWKNIKEWEFELLRLEASKANCTAVVSSYIGGDFYGRRPTKIDGYIVGKDDAREEFSSFCFT